MQEIDEFKSQIYVTTAGVKKVAEDLGQYALNRDSIDRILISPECIRERTKAVAGEVSRLYGNNPSFIVLSVLSGAQIFVSELLQYLPEAAQAKVQLEYIKVSSYKGTSSTGQVKLEHASINNFRGLDVLVVDDIVETQVTQNWVREYISTHNAGKVRFCTLLDKRINEPEHGSYHSRGEFVGFTIPNEFVVGMGMDHNGLFRALPYVAVLKTQ